MKKSQDSLNVAGKNSKVSLTFDDKPLLKHKSTDQYDNSIFSKFYILNDKPDGTKVPKRDTVNEEEELKVQQKKKSIWGKMFCCYIEESTYS